MILLYASTHFSVFKFCCIHFGQDIPKFILVGYTFFKELVVYCKILLPQASVQSFKDINLKNTKYIIFFFNEGDKHSLSKIIGNKAKEKISKQALRENK